MSNPVLVGAQVSVSLVLAAQLDLGLARGENHG